MDDILAALDVHTAKWVVDKALSGDLVSGRTVILVTHNIALTAPIAQYVVEVSRNGHVVATGTVQEVLKSNHRLRVPAQSKQPTVPDEAIIDDRIKEDVKNDKSDSGKLIIAEEVAIGRVSWKTMKLYIVSFGGPFVWGLFIAMEYLVMLFSLSQTWIMAYWSNQYETHPPSEVPVIKCVWKVLPHVLMLTIILCCKALTFVCVRQCAGSDTRLRCLCLLDIPCSAGVEDHSSPAS